jgi:type I restriction enzyme M protein
MLTSAIRSRIDALWDKFWSGGLSSPLTAMEQISYLLFMKRLDEEDLKRQADARILKQKYESLFAGNENYRWSRWKHLEGGEMLELVQQKVFSWLKALQDDKHPFTTHMKDAVFIIPYCRRRRHRRRGVRSGGVFHGGEARSR